MSLRGEVDPDLTQYHWHWLLFPLTDLLGPALVYSVGLKALEYPPTWADTQEEADLIEAAVIKHLNKE